MAAKPWAESDDTTLRKMLGEGLTLREIAKQMDRSGATISRHASALNLPFDRAVTAAATRATVVDAKARRSALGLAMLEDLETARLRIGKSESAREFQAAAQGMDALMRSYVHLLRMEPDDNGLTESRGLVGAIMAAIMMDTEGVERMNPTSGGITDVTAALLNGAAIRGVPAQSVIEGQQFGADGGYTVRKGAS